MTKVVWQENGVKSGEEQPAPPPLAATYSRIRVALVLQLLVGATLTAQLKPVPSHQPRRAASPPNAVAARVNGVAIGVEDVDAALNTVIPLNSYHQNVTPEKLDELRMQALDGLIDEELRYQEAIRLKIQVLPIEVEQGLDRARKTYADNAAFERARRESGATLPQLRASILRALMIQKAYAQVVTTQCQVSEADAAAYYRDNTARFLMPEQVRVSLITIGVDPSATKLEWERARKKADGVARRIATGTSFDALAREVSTDASKAKGGDLGFVHRGQLIDEFERALKGLAPGKVTPVIQTIYGFHLLRLVETRPAAQKSFADMKATIVRDLTETRCKAASADWSKRLRAAARVEIVESRIAAGKVAG
jgi:parvulin-like peptidyl-prolyl isomerase